MAWLCRSSSSSISSSSQPQAVAHKKAPNGPSTAVMPLNSSSESPTTAPDPIHTAGETSTVCDTNVQMRRSRYAVKSKESGSACKRLHVGLGTLLQRLQVVPALQQ